MSHHAISNHGEHHIEGQYESHRTRAVEIIASELLEIAKQHKHHQHGIEKLSCDERHAFRGTLLSLLLIAFERFQYAIRVFVHNLSAVHDFLPHLYLSHVGYQRVVHLLPLLL